VSFISNDNTLTKHKKDENHSLFVRLFCILELRLVVDTLPECEWVCVQIHQLVLKKERPLDHHPTVLLLTEFDSLFLDFFHCCDARHSHPVAGTFFGVFAFGGSARPLVDTLTHKWIHLSARPPVHPSASFSPS
jgi:hypothetical protein